MKHFTIFTALLFCFFTGNSQNISFKHHAPCTFSIDLPVVMKLKEMYTDPSPDFCDYKVKLNDGYTLIELHPSINSRFEHNTIQDFYSAALNSSTLNITYKMKTKNFFVISGFNKKNGNIVYWKRALGENFVSDMHIEYNKSRKAYIEPFIGKISKSFVSE